MSGERKRNRPDLPAWFTKEDAKFFRKNISKEEFNSIVERKKGFLLECKENGIDPSKVSSYWFKSKKYSIHSKLQSKSYEEIRDGLILEMDKYSPVYPKIERTKLSDSHLLVIDPADVHIGKLSSMLETGEIYNIEIAKKMVQDGVMGIVKKAMNYNIDKIIFVAGNDILHTDFLGKSTTSGTPQDTDGMWHDAFQAAKDLYVWCIETLMQLADVHFVYCPSNHDYTSGYYLADTIKSWFRLSDNVTFDCRIIHRKYVLYGRNLLGFSHGDGAKEKDLPDLMKTEAKKAWSEAKAGYWYLHHLHHKIRKRGLKQLEKDIFDITIIKPNDSVLDDKVEVEYLRTPSASDGWHAKNGYQHNCKSIEAFIHHPEHLQVARISHIF